MADSPRKKAIRAYASEVSPINDVMSEGFSSFQEALTHYSRKRYDDARVSAELALQILSSAQSRLLMITPPPDAERIHQDRLASFQTYVEATRMRRDALAAHDPVMLSQADELSEKAGKLLDRSSNALVELLGR